MEEQAKYEVNKQYLVIGEWITKYVYAENDELRQTFVVSALSFGQAENKVVEETEGSFNIDTITLMGLFKNLE